MNMPLSDKKKSYNIVLEKHVKNEIEKIANLESRTISNLVNYILKQYLKDREGEK
jgi:hypothetical protein